MKILFNRRNDALYIKLRGELDEHSASGARREVDRLADLNADCEQAVFDLAEVSFMDSTGIGFLIGRYKKFNRYGVKVYITNPSQTTDKILAMSGVYSLVRKL
ncbi:MAG: anti-sigma factor antagonist [Clostridia bacterium]|nr:anti-sigma factor antagonist [Clostridia bacterium]